MHMESTATRSSILAKLLGFYTVEVRNLETGTVLAKADLLVMENIFYSQTPTKTFDLKGIQGRKVKTSSKTLFDSEWIEGEFRCFSCTFLAFFIDRMSSAGQQRALTLVNPISKTIFQEAVRADCDFLARSNIMDYSSVIALSIYLSFLCLRGFPGYCSASMRKESKFTVVWWTPLAATRSPRRLSTRQRAFRRRGKTSRSFRLTSMRSVSCPRWTAILWRVQVRCACGSE